MTSSGPTPGGALRVAAVDCGTNSLRLLVSDAVPPERRAERMRLRDVVRRTEVVRLGEGVDAAGALSPAAMARAVAVSREYAATCAELGVARVRYVTTSASRDASNAGEFIEGVREAFAAWGIAPEVIAGREEADLSFRGATAAVSAAGWPGEYLVVDLGGGSTEFARGSLGVRQALSVDLGAVRLTERHVRSDPPLPAETMAIRAAAQVALDQVERRVGLGGVRTLVGLAGTVTTLTAHVLGLPSYDDSRVHLARLSVEDTLAAAAELAALTREERAALPCLHPGRVDVIVAGAVLWATIVERVRAASGVEDVVTSVHDLLDGMALDLAWTGGGAR